MVTGAFHIDIVIVIISDCSTMWARMQHDRWNEEVDKSKQATKETGVTKVADEKKTESTIGVETQLWVMQKMVTGTEVNNMVDGVFVQSICKNTELNQFQWESIPVLMN